MSRWEFGTFLLSFGLYCVLLNFAGKLTVNRKALAQPAAVVGAVLAVLAALLPWATFVLNDGPYPAKASLQFFDAPFELEGFRLRLALFGIAALVLNYVPIPGRHRAVRALGWAVGVISIVNLLMIGIKGGGFGATTAVAGTTAFGGFVGIVAGALLVIAGSAGGVEPIPQWPTDKLPRLAAYLVLLVSFAGLLWLVTDTLTSGGIGGPSSPYAGPEFLSYLGLLVGLLGALQALGVLKWISTISEQHRVFSIIILLLCAFGLPFTGAGNDYWMTVAVNIGVYAATAIGLNIVVGLAGLLDIGYVAFLGIGAFVAANLSGAAAAKLNGTFGEVPFILVLIICAVVAGIFGAIVGSPTLRVRGDYLAIVTLAFGEIFRKSAQENIGGLTGGSNAIPNIPPVSLGGKAFNEPVDAFGRTLPSGVLYYFFIVVLISVVMLIFANLKSSRIGRAWIAIREDEDAARAMGIKTGKAKILAFLVGATLAGLAGAVFAHKTSTVAYDSFQFLESVTLLAAVVLGGMGTIPGAVLGASLLFVLPEKLREFNDYRLLMFGLALVLIMRFRPQGLVPDRVRRAEFAGETPEGLSIEQVAEQAVIEQELAEAEAAATASAASTSEGRS
jgi:branched-chain amino acid transport system permease protein